MKSHMKQHMKNELLRIVQLCAIEKALDEIEFCKRFTFGHLAQGNSAFDLLSLLWDGCHAFRSFAEVAENYHDWHQPDDDWHMTKQNIENDLGNCLDFYDDLKNMQNRTIVA